MEFAIFEMRNTWKRFDFSPLVSFTLTNEWRSVKKMIGDGTLEPHSNWNNRLLSLL
jgi:hypothetical protein